MANVVIEFTADTTNLDPAFQKIQESERKLSEGAKVASGSFDKLNNNVKEVAKNAGASLVFDKSKDINKTVASMDSLKKRIREAVQETQQLAEAYGELDPRTVAAAKRAAELKERLGDVNKQIEALNPETKFNAFIQVAGGAAGALAAAQGAMALFGAESEDAQRTLVKLQGALNLAQGLNAVAGLSDSFKNLKSVLGLTQTATQGVTVATEGMAAANVGAAATANTATAATKGFTSALLTNPIFLVIAAVAALTAAFVLLGDETEEAEKAINSINDAYDEFNKNTSARSSIVNDSIRGLQGEIELMKVKGASAKDVAKKEEELLQLKINYNIRQKELNKIEIENIDERNKALFNNTAITEEQFKAQSKLNQDAINELKEKNKALTSDNESYKNESKVIQAKLTTDELAEIKARGDAAVKAEKENNERILKAKSELGKRIRDINTSLIEDEFLRREQELKNKFDDEVDIYAAQFDKKEISLTDFNKIYAKIEEKLTADILKIHKDRADQIAKQDKEEQDKKISQAEKDAKEVAEAIEYWDNYTLEKEQERKDKIIADIVATSDLFNSIAASFEEASQRKIDAIDNELESILSAYDKEAEANQELFKRKEISERDFRKVEEDIQKRREASEEAARKKKNEIARKEFAIKKAAALFEAIVNTAVAVTKAFKDGGVPLAILVGAAGAIEIATISAQNPPKFAKGTLSVGGTGNEDTIHALLTPGEAVIPQREAREYRPSLSAIYHRKIKPKDLNDLVEWKLRGGNTNVTATINEDKLAASIVWQMNNYGKKGVKILNVQDFKDIFNSGLYNRNV